MSTNSETKIETLRAVKADVLSKWEAARAVSSTNPTRETLRVVRAAAAELDLASLMLANAIRAAAPTIPPASPALAFPAIPATLTASEAA